MERSNLEVVYRTTDQLVVPDYNPRKITPKQREDIRRSLDDFGMVQPLVVNTFKDEENDIDRDGIIVGGNQRFQILKSMGVDKFPCVEVCLDPEQEKVLNLRLNKNQAEFDFDALNEFFEKEMLYAVGFSEKEVGKELSEFDQRMAAITNKQTDVAMPIVPKFNEKYGCVIITFQSELDEVFLLNFLRLEKAKDYKNSRMGVPYIMKVEDFQKIIQDYEERK
ncbi:MAG: ParB N-terminal domain-containing protein [Bacteroidaceae bacterium]|nr:ParB N-terminal domain-containing protein [Bacteroidaceae bacterium]